MLSWIENRIYLWREAFSNAAENDNGWFYGLMEIGLIRHSYIWKEWHLYVSSVPFRFHWIDKPLLACASRYGTPLTTQNRWHRIDVDWFDNVYRIDVWNSKTSVGKDWAWKISLGGMVLPNISTCLFCPFAWLTVHEKLCSDICTCLRELDMYEQGKRDWCHTVVAMDLFLLLAWSWFGLADNKASARRLLEWTCPDWTKNNDVAIVVNGLTMGYGLGDVW